MKRQLGIIIIVALAIGCSTYDTSFGPEDTPSSVSGRVVSETSGDPIPGAVVEIRKAKAFSYPCYGSSIKTIETDAKGEFLMKFVFESGFCYIVTVGPAIFEPGAHRISRGENKITIRI